MRQVHDDRSKSADDDVGYARPPKATQFRKGQSGNPRGRPRKSDAAKAPSEHWGISLHAPDIIFYEPVKATINGKQRSIPAIEAVHRRRINDAIRGGNRLLTREVIARADAHEQEELRRTIEQFLRLKEAKEKGAGLIAQAKARGLPEPELLPHPDDILIDDERITVTVDGPETRAERAGSDFIVAIRDHIVVRYVYQKRFPPLLTPFGETELSALQTHADQLDQLLCKRLQWGLCGFWNATRPYERKGYRFLEADLDASLQRLRKLWDDPALVLIRERKRFEKSIAGLLAFRTRRVERVIAQRQHSERREFLSAVFGEKLIAHIPMRRPLGSYAENQAVLAAATMPEARTAEEQTMLDRAHEALLRTGLFGEL